MLLTVLLAFTFLIGVHRASAAPFTGGFSPTVFGSKADLNGDDVVNGADDSNAFYGDTSIIDGMLDCDAWGTGPTVPNDGIAGDGAITAADDCTLVGYDGTVDGVTILVVNGQFATADGVAIAAGTALPLTYNASDPNDPSVFNSDFGWSTIGGKVDSNGNETIDASDGSLGLIGSTVDVGFGDPTDGADILSTCPGLRSCIARQTTTAVSLGGMSIDGLVDLDSDGVITAADTCARCFFGHALVDGFVNGPSGGGGGGGGGGTPTPTPPPTVVRHERTTPLALGRHLWATGTVHVADGTTECAANVTVDIQRWVQSHWRTVATVMTDANGAFRVHLPDHVGRYRALVRRSTLASGDICARATSDRVWHHH
ncbi:MAG: hypothetical protein ACXVEI_04085 [Actinomycetota bacterium]